MDVSSTGQPIPFHIAKAYGVSQVKPVQRVPAIQGGGKLRVTGTGREPIEANLDGVNRASGAGMSRLVAAVVPGSVGFDGSQATARPASMAFYTHPADQNAAALAINVGRSLDVRG